ncbi:MAG: hypothetical protein ABW278_06965 [Steroidobacteraceae bacterium]
MGTYTGHWNQYKRDSIRGVIRLLLLFAVGLPLTVLIALGVQRLTGSYPAYLHIGLLLLWLVSFTVLAVRHSRVLCPKCGTQYSRGKGLCNCPKCGLRMLQEEP